MAWCDGTSDPAGYKRLAEGAVDQLTRVSEEYESLRKRQEAIQRDLVHQERRTSESALSALEEQEGDSKLAGSVKARQLREAE